MIQYLVQIFKLGGFLLVIWLNIFIIIRITILVNWGYAVQLHQPLLIIFINWYAIHL